ncbi:MAG TPA: hypothetical protein VFP74_06115 [Pseudolabrys sp.]|jgi:hypothetical protein|nr:hypothetical protein [Pseudolabrys sp.]
MTGKTMQSTPWIAIAMRGWRGHAGLAITCLLLGSGLVTHPSAANADTIAEDTGPATTSLNSQRFGAQSVTTPAGRSWNNLTFNFVNFNTGLPSATSSALFLLTQAYTGTPSNLSSSTPGYVATATGNGSVWTFATNVNLASSTQYFFYSNTVQGVNLAVTSGDTYAGGQGFLATASTNNFGTTGGDFLFNLSGTSNPGPIPGTGLLSYLIAGLGGLAAFRKQVLAKAISWIAFAGSAWAKLSPAPGTTNRHRRNWLNSSQRNRVATDFSASPNFPGRRPSRAGAEVSSANA